MAFIYNDYGHWIRQQFPFRVQKISLNAGFTCPNRDGNVGRGGCIFCDNRTFNPAYCHPQTSIAQQIQSGKAFFSHKYPDMKYLAYFQAFSNTYASIELLKKLYEEALAQQDIVGLVISTRPDCISQVLLQYLAELNKRTFLIVEYGIESTNDKTLRLINRGHDFECTRKAIQATHDMGILTGGHVILGLPGEDEEESIRQASTISDLPLDILKIHQMQIIKGTRLAQMYMEQPFHLYNIEEYIRLISSYISRLRKDLVIERFASQSPSDMLIAPKWGLKNYEFTNLLTNYLRKNNIHQGIMLE